MSDPWSTWVVVADRIHRFHPDSRTLCGVRLGEVAKLNREQTLELVAVAHHATCVTCERELARLRPSAELKSPGVVLSAQQQVIRDQLDAEAWRRARAREDLEKETRTSRSSVRTVSGGLPSLGKRRP